MQKYFFAGAHAKGPSMEKLKISIWEKFWKIGTVGTTAYWNFFPHPSTPDAFSNAALPDQNLPRGRRANSSSNLQKPPI